MMQLYGFFTQNTLKTLYVLEQVGSDYEFIYMNLLKGEHKSDDFIKLNPLGKVPVLTHGGQSLFESGAICRYVANEANSDLYPQDKMHLALVDQWMDFFSNHLGRWLNTLFFEKIIKPKADMGDTDEAACAEAVKYSAGQFAVVDAHLAQNAYFTGDDLTIADLFAFAYIEQVQAIDMPLDNFPNVKAWFDDIEALDSIARARKKVRL